jgi:hypothetical protein
MEIPALYGPVNIDSFGTILVPGISIEDRIRYSTNLTTNVGVFVPTFKCLYGKSDRNSWHLGYQDRIDPVIAIGTLNNYKCIDISSSGNFFYAPFDPDIGIYIYNLIYDLHSFDSYFSALSNPYVWSETIKIFEIWSELTNFIRNLSSTTIEEVLQLLQIISTRAENACFSGLDELTPGDNIELSRILEIIPDLMTAEPKTPIRFDSIENETDWCSFAESVDEVYNQIQHIYNTFGQARIRQGFAITAPQRNELLTIGPAITYQPEGYAANLIKQQGNWKQMQQVQNINPNYRAIYEICNGNIIDDNHLNNILDELGIIVPTNYSAAQKCSYIKNYFRILPTM